MSRKFNEDAEILARYYYADKTNSSIMLKYASSLSGAGQPLQAEKILVEHDLPQSPVLIGDYYYELAESIFLQQKGIEAVKYYNMALKYPLSKQRKKKIVQQRIQMILPNKSRGMMKDCIYLSVFDIFKTGPGPSSSHTIGPMKAAGDFIERVTLMSDRPDLSSAKLEVFLYGSLSSTGRGHGTHKAVLGGLLGWKPESCDCDTLQTLLEQSDKVYEINLIDNIVPMTAADIHFAGDDPKLPFQNTIVFKLSQNKEPILEEEYYSVGGGFIQRKGEAEKVPPSVPHQYSNMHDFRELISTTDLTLSEIILQNEEAISGRSREEIFADIDVLISTMCQAVVNGLEAEGLLPGPIGLSRKAAIIFANSEKSENESERELARLNAFSIAAAEENADGRIVVTAPTSGSAGVLPGIIYMLKHYFKLSDTVLREGMLAAALIAFIAKHNASIAGAEVGCQGEIGVASSMAAALVTYAKGCDIKRIENAAEIALEHHLGMTCDPVDGYVQVPCVERNAVGAVTAFNAYILASTGDPDRQKVSFDEVVEAMLETGKDMSKKYKETAKGGLAVCCVSC